jgi:hypothetical protein
MHTGIPRQQTLTHSAQGRLLYLEEYIPGSKPSAAALKANGARADLGMAGMWSST